MWDSFKPEDWQTLPHISGRVATELDVNNGVAVFYIPEGSIAAEAPIPKCVIQIDEDGSRIPAVVIQAEQVDSQMYLGLRYINGGNGVCSLEDVEQLGEPNDEFLRSWASTK